MTTSNSHLSHPKYRPDIDGLRAVAVLSVVAFHAFPDWMKGGFIGVDIFFVISGFLISTIIFENLDKGTFSFAEFYARRIKRIYPALLLVLTVSIVFGWFALLADEYKQLGKHTMAGVGFVSNLVLWGESGYFDNAAETKPLLHLWSLGIEEQFYFLWPLLCWLFWRMNFRRIALLLSFILASFVLNIYMIRSDGVATFYSPLTRFWELLFGSLLAFIVLYHKSFVDKFQKNQFVINGFSLFGFLILGFGFLSINKDAYFPGFWALIPVIGAVLIIFAGPNAMLNRLFLSNKIVVWFGLISFPLYLWHWPLLTFLRIVERGTPDRFLRLAAVFLSILLAWLTYKFVEGKIRKSKGYKFVGTLVLLSFVLFLSGSAVFYKDGFAERKAVTTSDFTKEVQYQFMGPIWAYTKNDTCLSEYPYKDQNNLAWWFCMKSGTKPPTILLLGNSYANQLYPGFAKNEKLKHQTILSIGTCGVGFDNSGDDPRSPCYGSRITDQAKFIDDIIKRTPSIKFVILDGLSRKPSNDEIGRVIQRIDFLEKQGVKVIIFTPHIRPGFHPKACFKSPLKQHPKDCLVSSDVRSSILKDFNPLLVAVHKTHPSVLVFEQNDVFCDRKDGKCSYVKNGLPLYRDEGHTSEYASLLLQDYFTKWASSHVPSMLDSAPADN
ncbi:acyltransferase family protein [Pectobacterium jejuense]|uniref:acyltransferase family protein n=1 Tax=Pectobacterium jejuense TaxID=2974022 RepID=UPI00227F5538|nr:acyltransferase family protein [Pectobacterium jejuense]MCY9848249.1 acyltransferase family protein [Pectobacterium jejuense]